MDKKEYLVNKSKEIRDIIIKTVKNNGGHYSSPLGVVELTTVVYDIFDLSKDKIIWDTGHQAYAHKINTDRKDDFHKLRKTDGISGFLDRTESEFDLYGAGHAATSTAVSLGYCHINNIIKSKDWVISIIGDGAFSCGLSLESLNLFNIENVNYCLILNNNGYSISDNVGSLNQLSSYELLAKSFGFKYHKVVDGHNVDNLYEVFNNIKTLGGRHFVEVKTIKGKGDIDAENNPVSYHAYSNSNGKVTNEFANSFVNYIITNKENHNLILVTPGMKSGIGLDNLHLPIPIIDVGITESSAVIFSSVFSIYGWKPILHIYSTFAQRAFDQFIHDIAIQNIPMLTIVDRCSLSGFEGPTHHGILDLLIWRIFDDISVFCPSTTEDFIMILNNCINEYDKPNIIRTFKGVNVEWCKLKGNKHKILTQNTILRSELSHIVIFTYGQISEMSINVSNILKEKHNITISIIEIIRIIPLGMDDIYDAITKNNNINCVIVLEEVYKHGSISEDILNYLYNNKIEILFKTFNIVKSNIKMDSRTNQLKSLGISEENIIDYILSINNK